MLCKRENAGGCHPVRGTTKTLGKHKTKVRSTLKAYFELVTIGAIVMLSSGFGAQPDWLSEAKQTRDTYVRTFRETGRIDPALLAPSVPGLEALAATGDGATRARALYELGTIQRMTNNFSHAATT